MENEKISKVLDFFQSVSELKRTLRYKEHHKDLRESSADHSWQTSVMAMILTSELSLDIDINRAIKIALVHDISEAVTDDIAATVTERNAELFRKKKSEELEAIQLLTSKLPEKSGKEICDLWMEYREGKTEEAKFVKALNKLEANIHCLKFGYETYDDPYFIVTHSNKAAQDFPPIKEVAELVKEKLKVEFEKGNIPWKDKEEYEPK